MENIGHFAYEKSDSGQLFQGDLLERTPDLEEILKKFYPYAFEQKDKYPYFLVLTQSCDLVRRDDKPPKAEHITLSATRSIQFLLKEMVADLQTPELKKAGIVQSDKKEKLLQEIERLLSNELPPYFYLHPKDTPFVEPHVSYLRITFPIKCDHYNACLKAKKLQLTDVFRAKLGWLTTFVYGRVATKDFDQNERKAYANEYANSVEGIEWRRRKSLNHWAKSRDKKLEALSAEEIEQMKKDFQDKTFHDDITDHVVRMATEVLSLDDDKIKTFRNRLKQDQILKSALSD